MQWRRSTSVILGVMMTCAALAGTSLNQEYKKGDEVIALRNAQLQVEAKAVGTVRKGGKLIVEDIQGTWLWVRSVGRLGWIDSRSVMAASLMAWYQRQDDTSSVQEGDRTRAKFAGVTFEVLNAGSGPGIQFNGPTIVNNGMFERFGALNVAYSNVRIAMRELDDRRALSIDAKPYGIVEKGDHVFVNESRGVLVNGQLRKAKVSEE